MIPGKLFITNNIDIVFHPIQPCVILNMDEEKKLSMQLPNCIEGTCLLPPVDAKIAEVDGDELKYNTIYMAHLAHQEEFMAAIIMYLFKGGTIIIYLPDEYNYTKEKLTEFLFTIYGLKPGDIDTPQDPMRANFIYDGYKTPYRLNLLYVNNLINAYEWLRNMIPTPNMECLGGNKNILFNIVCELNPYTKDPDDMAGKLQAVEQFHMLLTRDPNIIMPIRGV